MRFVIFAVGILHHKFHSKKKQEAEESMYIVGIYLLTMGKKRGHVLILVGQLILGKAHMIMVVDADHLLIT